MIEITITSMVQVMEIIIASSNLDMYVVTIMDFSRAKTTFESLLSFRVCILSSSSSSSSSSSISSSSSSIIKSSILIAHIHKTSSL